MGDRFDNIDELETLDDGWDDQSPKTRVPAVLVGIAAIVVVAILAYTQLPAFDDAGSSADGDTGDLALGMIDGFAPQPGEPAPDFVLEDQDGRRLRLADFEGKPVFLNFWAEWCTFCKQEMPDMQRIQERFGDELVVLGVNAGDPVSTGEQFVNSVGVTYIRAYDVEQNVTSGYRVQAMPTSYFINADGVIADFNFGFMIFDQMLEKVQISMDSAGG